MDPQNHGSPRRNGMGLVLVNMPSSFASTMVDNLVVDPKRVAHIPWVIEILNPRINVHWFWGRSPSKYSMGIGPEFVDAELACLHVGGVRIAPSGAKYRNENRVLDCSGCTLIK